MCIQTEDVNLHLHVLPLWILQLRTETPQAPGVGRVDAISTICGNSTVHNSGNRVVALLLFGGVPSPGNIQSDWSNAERIASSLPLFFVLATTQGRCPFSRSSDLIFVSSQTATGSVCVLHLRRIGLWDLRINLGGKALTNYLKELVSFRFAPIPRATLQCMTKFCAVLRDVIYWFFCGDLILTRDHDPACALLLNPSQ